MTEHQQTVGGRRHGMVGRVVSWESCLFGQGAWMLEDSWKWERDPSKDGSWIAIDGSFTRTAGKYAACGSAVIQMDPDGALCFF